MSEPTPTKTIRSTEDVAAGIKRQIISFGKRLTEGDPNELLLLAELQAEIDKARTLAVEGMRNHGITDGEIAEILQVTRQAVSKRWPGDGSRRGAGARYPKLVS